MYLLTLLEMIGKCPHISDYILPSFESLGSTVTKNTRLVFLLSHRSVYGAFFLVDYTP